VGLARDDDIADLLGDLRIGRLVVVGGRIGDGDYGPNKVHRGSGEDPDNYNEDDIDALLDCGNPASSQSSSGYKAALMIQVMPTILQATN
jgi:hypothetical protein